MHIPLEEVCDEKIWHVYGALEIFLYDSDIYEPIYEIGPEQRLFIYGSTFVQQLETLLPDEPIWFSLYDTSVLDTFDVDDVDNFEILNAGATIIASGEIHLTRDCTPTDEIFIQP